MRSPATVLCCSPFPDRTRHSAQAATTHRRGRRALALAFSAVVAVSQAGRAQAAVSPGTLSQGVQTLASTASVTPQELGAHLALDLACAACHSDARLDPLQRTRHDRLKPHPALQRAPDLSAVGGRASPQWLRAFLLDPQATQPGTSMPDLLSDDRDLRREQVEDLVHFLTSDVSGGPLAASETSATTAEVDGGRALYHSIGCAVCHGGEGVAPRTVGAYSLDGLASKTTVEALTEFLRAPHAVRRSGKMPDFHLSPGAARNLSIYLLRAQLGAPDALRAPPIILPGLSVDYYEVEVESLDDVPAQLDPIAQGVSSVRADPEVRRREDRYLLRFRGEIEATVAGKYEFAIDSDDGARLRIDGVQVVDNDGVHPKRRRTGKIELTAGVHTLELDYFELNGGESLKLSWLLPGAGDSDWEEVPDTALRTQEREPMVPLGWTDWVPDRGRSARGQALFASLGCASCHSPRMAEHRDHPLHDVDAGCLADTPPTGAPRYTLSATQRAALRARLSHAPEAPSVDVRVRAGLAWFNCYACHTRGDVEWARTPEIDELFEVSTEIDLGDEARVPPRLDGVGDKLLPAALHGIVAGDSHRIRGHLMHTRMPSFAGTEVEPLLAALVRADRTAAPRALEFEAEHVGAGRRLVGVESGFACITCHSVNGYRSPALPGVDLVHAHERLNSDWFGRFLRNPHELAPGTRMPGFWSGPKSAFTELLEGSTAAQITAVWSYLSLGASMAPPAGVLPPADRPQLELVPVAEPIVHRTFMQDVGPWAITVGHPEGAHAVYDAREGSIVRLWRGRFFDGGGVASGRTDTFHAPLGEAVLDLPRPALALGALENSGWPAPRGRLEDAPVGFKGYRLDAARRPIFRRVLADQYEVTEQVRPVTRSGGTTMTRVFTVTPRAPRDALWLLAWRGPDLRPIDGAPEPTWRDADGITVRVLDPVEADVELWSPPAGDDELRVVFPLEETVTFSVEVQW